MTLKLYSASFAHSGMAVAVATSAVEAAKIISEERAPYTYGEIVDPSELTEYEIKAGCVINDMGDA